MLSGRSLAPGLCDGLGRPFILGGAERVERASNARSAQAQHVRVDHRRLDIRVAQQLLDGADVVAVVEQMRSERVPQGMA